MLRLNSLLSVMLLTLKGPTKTWVFRPGTAYTPKLECCPVSVLIGILTVVAVALARLAAYKKYT